MDSLSKTVVNNPQLSTMCQCCYADGSLKDMSIEYYFSDRREVYEDMLRDTFDIQLSPNSGLPCRLICEKCISRLRDANDFKEMVKRTQENFAKLLKNHIGNGIEGATVENPDLKVKEIKEEMFFDDYMTGDDDRPCKSDDDDDDDDIPQKMEMTMSKENGAEVRLKSRRKLTAGRKTRKKAGVNETTEELDGQSHSKKDWLKIVERRGNGPLLRENSIKLIKNSTICVFQWNKSRYRCFCCTEPFSDLSLLRDHTNTAHNLENIEKKIILQQNRLVKVEISILFCKICGNRLETLSSLKEHLKSHDVNFESDEDLLVPFKIEPSNLQCQICCQKFAFFRLLNIHMNKHFRNQVCHICGAGFSNLVFLNLHRSRYHRPFACKECDIVFKSKLEKKDHDISVHNVKTSKKLRFPCPYCQQRFFQENFRVQHLVDKHGMNKPEHKCTVCSKVFITRSLCNNHIKKVHMKEKNQECDVCHHLFYTKSDVSRHKVTHTGEKKYSCSLCSNLFSTKDSLRRHLKRSHVCA